MSRDTADEAPWPAPPQRPPAAAAPSTRPFVALADLLLSQPDAQGSLDAIWRCYAAAAAEQAPWLGAGGLFDDDDDPLGGAVAIGFFSIDGNTRAELQPGDGL